MGEEAANATRAVPYGILMSIGSCWLFGFIICIVIAACVNPDLEAVLGSSFGQPMAQIYYDAIGKKGALALMSLLFIVQFLMGLSILVAASRQSWGECFLAEYTDFSIDISLQPSPVTVPYLSAPSSVQSPETSATSPSAQSGVAFSLRSC